MMPMNPDNRPVRGRTIRITPVIILLGCLWLGAGQVRAQGPWKFRSQEYGGILAGEKGSFGQVQTINGLYKKSWFLGVGAGLDYYRFRSVPVFLSVNKDLMPGKNGLFLSLDGGANYPWYKRAHPSYGYVYPTSGFHSGAYWSASLGYKIKLSAHGPTVLLLSAGYSFKELKEDYGYIIPPCPLGTACPLDVPADRYDYNNKRVSVKAGIQF
jgi:hypothetical protein